MYDSVWCVYDIVCVYVYLVAFPCSVVWLQILMYCDIKVWLHWEKSLRIACVALLPRAAYARMVK